MGWFKDKKIVLSSEGEEDVEVTMSDFLTFAKDMDEMGRSYARCYSKAAINYINRQEKK